LEIQTKPACQSLAALPAAKRNDPGFFIGNMIPTCISDDVAKYLSDKWLADNTLFGPAAKVRDGVAAWRAAGVHTPILVPSSAAGNQMKAIEEVFAAFG
jgi:hypothetical protein